MTNRHHLNIVSGTVALVLLASSATHPVLGRTPWAATSGLHFVDAVVAADNYRAAAGGLAMKKSPSLDVREFGRMLWEDSIENWRRLKWVLTKAEPNVVLPTHVSTHDMFLMDQLVPVSGDAFDGLFIAQQTASLRETLALAEGYARTGDDLDLKEFAARSVPKIKMQLDRILEIEMGYQ
jgi:putative membrane protein